VKVDGRGPVLAFLALAALVEGDGGGWGPSTSRTKTSAVASVSAGSRLFATEWNATKRPSAERAGPKEPPLPFAPAAPVARLASVVVFEAMSRTKTSKVVSGSAGSRFDAEEVKATKRPSAETADDCEN